MRLLSSLAGLLLVAGAAAAQTAPDQAPPSPPPGQMAPGGQMAGPNGHVGLKARFEAANTTNDGKLTLEQARTAHFGQLVRNFDQIDSEHKGYIMLQDIRAWHQAMKQARGGQLGAAPQNEPPPPQ